MLEKSLPSEYYRSPEIFAKERERIFSREWVCAGRADELPPPGEVRILDMLGESLLLTRTKEGRPAAHYNVCRHRGARLCEAEDGGAELGVPKGGAAPGSIRCPYHSWTYGLDGRLAGAPYLNQDPTLRREEMGLHPVGLGVWGGFLFLNLWPAGPRARDFVKELGAMPERVRRYPLDALRTARRITYDVRANWKVVAENYNECYHCAGVHPELCEVVPAFREKGGAGLDWEHGVPHRDGAFTFTRSGTTDRAPFPGLSEEEKVRPQGGARLSEPLPVALARARDDVPPRSRGARPHADRVRLPLRPRGDGPARFRPFRRRRVLGSHQSPGLVDLRGRPAGPAARASTRSATTRRWRT